MNFFVGLHIPAHAQHFDRCCISVNRLRNRKSNFKINDWILESGAFTEISTFGEYRDDVSVYANQIRRWSACGKMLAAVSQDYMCEPFALEKTGLTVGGHHRLTIERYDDLLSLDLPVYLLPVIQGFDVLDYQTHIDMYGSRLKFGAWVGVGSVCKRNASPAQIESILCAIHERRPDLNLHGFGIKTTSLSSGIVRRNLYSADSMAWSFAARRKGRNPNDWKEAERFTKRIENQEVKNSLF